MVDDLLRATRNLYAQEITAASLPNKFNMSTLKHCDGSTNPQDHLENYSSLMILHDVFDTIMRSALYSTLEGNTKLWFRRLPEGSSTT